MKRFSGLSLGILLILLLVGGVFIAGCTTTQPGPTTTTAVTTIPTTVAGEKTKLLVATTTSLYDTGLLNYLEPKFESMYNVDLQITSQGTGKAIEIAKKVDLLFRNYSPRIFSVDFLFDKEQKPYVVECNSQPMIDKYAYGKWKDLGFYDRMFECMNKGLKVKVYQQI